MNKLNRTRYYEITELRAGSAWIANDKSNSIIGAIVRPCINCHAYSKGVRGGYTGDFRFVVDAPSGREIHRTSIYIVGVSLRPLTIKEQENIDGSRHDAA